MAKPPLPSMAAGPSSTGRTEKSTSKSRRHKLVYLLSLKQKGGHKIICLWTYVSMDKYVHGHISGMCLFCPGLTPVRAATLAPNTEVTSENADVRRHVTDRAGHARSVVTDETVGRVGATLTDVTGATTGGRTDVDASVLPPRLTRDPGLALSRVRATPSPLVHPPGAGHVNERCRARGTRHHRCRALHTRVAEILPPVNIRWVSTKLPNILCLSQPSSVYGQTLSSAISGKRGPVGADEDKEEEESHGKLTPRVLVELASLGPSLFRGCPGHPALSGCA